MKKIIAITLTILIAMGSTLELVARGGGGRGGGGMRGGGMRGGGMRGGGMRGGFARGGMGRGFGGRSFSGGRVASRPMGINRGVSGARGISSRPMARGVPTRHAGARNVAGAKATRTGTLAGRPTTSGLRQQGGLRRSAGAKGTAGKNLTNRAGRGARRGGFNRGNRGNRGNWNRGHHRWAGRGGWWGNGIGGWWGPGWWGTGWWGPWGLNGWWGIGANLGLALLLGYGVTSLIDTPYVDAGPVVYDSTTYVDSSIPSDYQYEGQVTNDEDQESQLPEEEQEFNSDALELMNDLGGNNLNQEQAAQKEFIVALNDFSTKNPKAFEAFKYNLEHDKNFYKNVTEALKTKEGMQALTESFRKPEFIQKLLSSTKVR